MIRTIAAVLALAATLAGCAIPEATADGFNSVVNAKQARVTYELLGQGRAQNVTYSSDGSGSMGSEESVKMPWHQEVAAGGPLNVVTILAQNSQRGEIKCRIYVNGKVVKESVAHGRYAIVSCTTGV